MGKHKPKSSFKPGDSFTVPVKQEHINDSDPCNKDNCMVTRAIFAWLKANYGDRNFHVKSTNHGAIFRLGNREYVLVFDHATAAKIYKYDNLWKKTRSKEQAQKVISPFKVRLMVEATRNVVVWPPMSDATKQKLRAMPRKKQEHKPRPHSSRRELSL